MDGGTVKGVACIGIDANRVYIFKIILRVIVIILILLCCVISVTFFNGDIQEDFKSAVSGYV